MSAYEIRRYATANGADIYARWLTGLADRQAKARIAMRIERLAAGNFGDCRPLQGGVWEMRIDHGPGYRVYYAKAGRSLILLLCGGDKRKQQGDIERAVSYWRDWQRRKMHEQT